jgi:glutathione S-transferase
MRLHYIPTTASMAPHAALAEAGADYELVLVRRDEEGQSPPEYLALNPWGRVPTLEDGGLVLTEAAAIVLHVGDRFPDSGLLPPVGTPERSQVYRWLTYLTNTVQTGYMRWFYPERYTADPAGEDAIRAREAEVLRRHLDWLDGELAGRPWLARGGERTGADLYLFMLTRWGRFQEPPAWDRPHLRAHFNRLRERPGVLRMLEEQGIEVPDLDPLPT